MERLSLDQVDCDACLADVVAFGGDGISASKKAGAYREGGIFSEMATARRIGSMDGRRLVAWRCWRAEVRSRDGYSGAPAGVVAVTTRRGRVSPRSSSIIEEHGLVHMAQTR